MGGTWIDRSERLFGRKPDLDALIARAGMPGLTAVVGRPQIGKTWLLAELARRLSASEPPHLVGLAESREGEPDLPLRAIVDLYARWLEQAGKTEQAAMVWEQQSATRLEALAAAVKSLGVLKPAHALLNGLLAANKKLRTGGVQLPPLQYDQALGLLQAIHGLTRQSLVVILDQWEKSQQIAGSSRLLDAFIRNVDAWPPCHILLGVRSESEHDEEEAALAKVEALERARPGRAGLYRLSEMHLEGQEGHRAATWVRSNVPAAANQSDATLLGEVAGFPGVLMRWSDRPAEIADADALRQLAADAHAYRYPELERALSALDGDLRRLAIRLALLPHGAGELWPVIKAEVLGDLDETLLDDLCGARVLESQEPLSFGHPKRFEVARSLLFDSQHFRTACRCEAERTILAMGKRVRSTDPSVNPFIFVLAAQTSLFKQVPVSEICRPVCFAAVTMLRVPVRRYRVRRLSQYATDSALLDVAPILAMGLLNTFLEADRTGARKHREEVLKQLRFLTSIVPAVVVQQCFARVLVNDMIRAKEEENLDRRDESLNELRALFSEHGDDDLVRKALSMALFNALNHAKAEGDLSRRDELLDDLRAVAEANPDDGAVREVLGSGLNHNQKT